MHTAQPCTPDERLVRLSLGIAILTALASTGASSSQAPRLPLSAGMVIYVASEPELQQAVDTLESNTTIVIAPGTYWLTGTLNVNGPLTNIVIRGATDNPADVALVGRGMGNENFDDVPHGIATGGAVHRLTIANLTIRDVYAHAVMIDAGAVAPRLYNVVMANAGRQLVKAYANEGGGVPDGLVEYSVFDYTSTPGDSGIGGLEVMAGRGWTVRQSLFRNIHAPGQLAGPAVLMWSGSRETVVERNTFVDCQREISLGLDERSPADHAGGIVRNNFIARRGNLAGAAAISLVNSPNIRVLHNTILANGGQRLLIDYRARGTQGVIIRNNLLDGEILARDAASATVADNYLNARPAMFLDSAVGNLRLRSTATEVIDRVPVIPEADADYDGEVRPQGAAADYGADEAPFGAREAPDVETPDTTDRAPEAPVTTPRPDNQPPSVSIRSPVHGATYTEPASFSILADASDPDGAISRVEFFAGSTSIGTAIRSPYQIVWQNAPAGTYTISARAWDNTGASMISPGVNVTVAVPSTQLAGWQTADVGDPRVTGSASYSSATFTVSGSGTDIGETADQFRFVYQPLEGDGEISACIAALDYVDSWTKAGVMIRESLATDARYAFSLVSAGWGVAFHHRSASGAKSEQAGVAPGLAPHCVRLVRRGNVFSAYQSVDGRKWVALGSRTIVMSPSAYVGLAVTSHDAARTARAIVNQVSLRPGR